MTTEQQRKMLECAAKACGMWESRLLVASKADGAFYEYVKRTYWKNGRECREYWNPLTNPGDTAEMCARLDINTYWWPEYVDCTTQNISCDIPHDGTPEDKGAAWRLAASMAAAKVGGYADDI